MITINRIEFYFYSSNRYKHDHKIRRHEITSYHTKTILEKPRIVDIVINGLKTENDDKLLTAQEVSTETSHSNTERSTLLFKSLNNSHDMSYIDDESKEETIALITSTEHDNLPEVTNATMPHNCLESIELVSYTPREDIDTKPVLPLHNVDKVLNYNYSNQCYTH